MSYSPGTVRARAAVSFALTTRVRATDTGSLGKPRRSGGANRRLGLETA